MPQSIAFLGLGAMGTRMVRNLLEARHHVVVYNRSIERARALEADGATVAKSPREAAAHATFVISMVRDAEASREIWLDPDHGAVHSLTAQHTAIESSTLTPTTMKALYQALQGTGAAFLDAPVVGSRPHTENKALLYLIGGQAAALEASRPILEANSKVIHHVGEVGQGTALKLAVNGLFGIQITALSEFLGYLEKEGIGQERAMEIMGEMPITSPVMTLIAGLIAKQVFGPLFPIDLVEKDFGYIAQAASNVGATVPVSIATRDVFAAAQNAGHGQLNIHGVAKLFGL